MSFQKNTQTSSQSHKLDSASAHKNKWYILFSVGMGVFLATIDSSIVNIALPTLVKSFNTKFAVVQWVVLSYMLTIATLLLSMGRLGDLRGKKGIYLRGMIIFTFGSILCGLSQTIYWLIFFRVVQGIGAAMMASLGAAMVTEAFPGKERGKALGTIGGIVSIGIITGPVLGGILIDVLSWHWIFFVNIPLGILGLVMVWRFVPVTLSVKEQRFDFAGAGIMFISVLSFLLALTLGQNMGFRNHFVILLFGIWIVSFIIFLYLELNVEHPMIDLHIFRNSLFSLNLFTGYITFIATAGVVLLMPFYLENVLGYNPHQVGFLLATVPLSAGFVSPLSGMLSDRFGSRVISTVGLAFLVGGYYSLTTLSEGTTALGYILRFLPVGLGIGIFQSPNNSAIMGAAPKKYLGIVSGLLSISRTLGQISGIAAIGAFWAARVSFYAGTDFAAGPTRTNITAQIHGLHDALSGIVILVALGFFMNIWGLMLEWIQKSSHPD
jgi:EmrB/QacA subfamily drug resistance transporter